MLHYHNVMKEKQVVLLTLDEAHSHFAVAYNQAVWKHLENEERSQEDTQTMIHSAHASLMHWAASSKAHPMHHARALYLLATVYTAANRYAEAIFYAKACSDYTDLHKSELRDFDLAYMYLALGRAYALDNQRLASMEYFTLSRQAGNQIADEEDKKIFLNDFRTKV
jgi:tetratricopeptide (TPR) repeat protein